MFGGKWGRLSPQTGGGQCTQGLASLCLAEGRGAVQGRGVHMGQGMGNLGKWLCAEVRPGPGVPLGENSSGVLGNSQEFLWWHFFKPHSVLALQSVVLKPRGTQAPEALDTGAGSSASRRGWSGIRPGMRGSSCASASQETEAGHNANPVAQHCSLLWLGKTSGGKQGSQIRGSKGFHPLASSHSGLQGAAEPLVQPGDPHSPPEAEGAGAPRW